jgi:hypothetical protein
VPRELVDLVTTSSPKIETKLGNLNASILLDSESVRSLIAVIHIQQLRLADRKVETFPTGLFNLTIFV